MNKNLTNHNFYQRLYELENVFLGELDFSHLAKNILVTVINETQSTAGILYWMDDVQLEYKIKTITGIQTTNINFVTKILRQPGGLLEKFATKPESLLLETLTGTAADNFSGMAELADLYRSTMVVPLSASSKNLGLMILFTSKNNYTKEQLRLLTAFAPRAAVHLDNARLYQVAQETALENSRLYVNISKLYQQATTDELTGLSNRNYLLQRTKEELKKAWRFKQPLSVIFIDLDYFKSINDKHGHQTGDQVLMEFGEFIKSLIREYDIACRFGGEEFVILLPQTYLHNARDLAERLREKIQNYRFVTPKNIALTACFGVNAISDSLNDAAVLDEEDLVSQMESLIAGADEALYRAKYQGRNLVVSHQEAP